MNKQTLIRNITIRVYNPGKICNRGQEAGLLKHTFTHTINQTMKQKTKFTTEWSVTFGNRHFQVSTQAADTAFSAKRIPQALEGVRKFLQPHRSLHHKRVRVLYQAEFQFENVPKIIKRNFQTKFPC